MSNQVNAKAGLSVKDLVTTGIFTALLFVFIMVGGVFFATNPVLTFFMPAGSALLAGPIAQCIPVTNQMMAMITPMIVTLQRLCTFAIISR